MTNSVIHHATRRQFARQACHAVAASVVFPWVRWPGARRFDRVAERPHLDVALRAAEWLWSLRAPDATGVTWPWDAARPGHVDVSLYTGTPGVLLFLGELYHATRDERFAAEMRAGARALAARLDRGEIAGHGLYVGRAGVGYVLHLAFVASGDPSLERAAMRAFTEIMDEARPVGRGVGWVQPGPDGEVEVTDIVSGAAGTGLSLLFAHRFLGRGRALDVAVAAGHRLVELAREAPAGLTWAMSASYPRSMPNFSHGTAGVAFFLSELYQRTGERRFLDAALGGAEYLQSQMTFDDERGWTVFHHEPGGEDLFYLSWCHGPVGTARLFRSLAAATGDESWSAWVHQGAVGIMNTGIPETRTPGFWNNVSQCCGTAGVGEFFLTLRSGPRAFEHAAAVPRDQRRRYDAFLTRLTDDLLARASTEQGRTSWTQAEHRVRPDLLQAQTGFMQGAAGMATFFLRLDGRAEGREPWFVLPDSPWG